MATNSTGGPAKPRPGQKQTQYGYDHDSVSVVHVRLSVSMSPSPKATGKTPQSRATRQIPASRCRESAHRLSHPTIVPTASGLFTPLVNLDGGENRVEGRQPPRRRRPPHKPSHAAITWRFSSVSMLLRACSHAANAAPRSSRLSAAAYCKRNRRQALL